MLTLVESYDLEVKSPCSEIGLPTFECRLPLLTNCGTLAQLLLDSVLVRVLPEKQTIWRFYVMELTYIVV